MRRLSTENALLVAGALSLALHATIGSWMAWARVRGEATSTIIAVEFLGPDEVGPAYELPEAEEPPLVLGLEQSEADSKAWLGVETITEAQQAAKSDVEQAALSPNAAAENSAEAPSPVIEQAERVESTVQEQEAHQSAKAITASPPLGPPIPDWLDELDAQASVMPRAETVPITEPKQSESEKSQDFAQQARPAAPAQPEASSGAQAGVPGLMSDKEAAGTSLLDPIQWRVNGQVLAAEGLEITPKAPQWDFVTRATQRPRDPVVQIKFGRDGRVKKAWFVRQGDRILNAGAPSVDEPIMHAIYRWRAKGERLTKLSAADEDAGVIITVKISL